MANNNQLLIPEPIFDTLENFKKSDLHALKVPAQFVSDFKAALDFLTQYSNNKATFESYRREIERLLQWAWLIRKQSILGLKRQDLEEYISFCLKPPKSWIALKRVPRFIEKDALRLPNPEWRPFVVSNTKFEHKRGLELNKNHYHLSQKAIQEIFTVLSSFYNALILEEKIGFNPIALIKQKSKYLQKQQRRAAVMRLTEQQWRTCLDTVKEMAGNDPEKHERTLFIITMFYLLYLRISELVASSRWIPEMGHFYQDSNKLWWFKTVGKGNKMRDIAVSDNMLEALKRYRLTLNLPPLPLPNEKTSLISKEKGLGPITSSRHIRRIMQLCFDNTIEKLRATGFESEADALEAATVHWLRHTGISDDINKRGRPIVHVRDDAGHASVGITDRYNDVELIERHKSAKNKKCSVDS